MTQVKTDILLNKARLEIHPSKLTKCGEIHINDDCTNAFLFCAFCSDEDDPDVKFFRTLAEFVDHIRWHRSDDVPYLQSPTPPKDATKGLIEALDDDSRSNLSATRHVADDLTDWIAPPEELFELNTISSFIEMEPHTEPTDSSESKELAIAKTNDCLGDSLPPILEQEETPTKGDEMPEITGEVFIDLLELYKKCPCLWHAETAAKTSPKTIDAVYKMLATHYNKCSQQFKSAEYVRDTVSQIKNCFLEEYKDVHYSMNDSMDCLPWYYPYLRFLLDSDSEQLDTSIFTDFLCPLCAKELTSQDELWEHFCEFHLEIDGSHDDSAEETVELQDKQIIQWGHYPQEVLEKFIEVYKSQTRLWDKKNDEYYKRALRRQSHELLLKILRDYDPEATRGEVINKVNKLRSQFAYERQKVLNSQNNKNVPRSWLYNKLKFLANNVTKNQKPKPPPSLKVRPANFKKKVKNAKCTICAASFTDHSAWLSHMQSAHTSDKYKSEDGFFYCTICGWQNKTKELLVRHLRNRHTNNMHKCNECDMGFRLLSLLVEHRAKVHDDYLPFKCENCGEGFTTRARLRTHSATHFSGDDLSHMCEHCGAKFADRNTYITHICRHEVDEKNREAPLSSVGELRKHLCTHLDDYSHFCDSCGKNFSSAHLLTTHLNEVHSVVDVPFPCNESANELQAEDALNDHIESHQQQHDCDMCGANFSWETSLRKHKRLKHGCVSNDCPL